MRYYIENFGCQMNDHDMEKAVHLLTVAGYEPVEDLSDAQMVIVNTCCVREKAEHKFYSFMGRLKIIKRKRRLILGVTGCVAQLEKENILGRLPFIDFALGPASIHKIHEAAEAAGKKKKFFDFSDNGCLASLQVRPGNLNRSVKAFVTIMKGCNNFCSYCVVPYVRGREVSRPSDDVLSEIRELAATGVKEVTLLGQNVNSYNNGKDDLAFPELLKRVNAIYGIERIRFVTSHPRDFSPALIDCFGTLDKLCENIHLPFQSGSTKVLKLMNRGYTIEEYIDKIEMLRSRRADISVTADCIVGFPGEDDSDFRATMALVEKIGFDGVYSFCFSPRKFTAAAQLSDTVPKEMARQRLYELQSMQKEITKRRYKDMEGTRTQVLVEGPSKNSDKELTGRTRTNMIVNFQGTRDMIGELVDVEIVKGYANSLKGAEPKPKEA